MRRWPLGLLLLFTLNQAYALEAFKVKLFDRKVRVEAPPTIGSRYSVIIENLSMTDITGKFVAGHQDKVFVTVKAGQSRTVEFTNPGKEPMAFQALAPAFQQVILTAGKGPYEIPPQR